MNEEINMLRLRQPLERIVESYMEKSCEGRR